MDLPDTVMEVRLANKRTFTDFLDQDHGRGGYVQKIKDMISAGQHRLLVNMSDLRDFDPALARRILTEPSGFIQPFEEALGDMVRNVDAKYLAPNEEVHLGFEGAFGSHVVTPRELLSSFLNTMVCVEGIVTKCSLVRPKVVKSVHYAEATSKFVTRVYRDVTAPTGNATGAAYPTRDDEGNLLTTEFGLCQYRDHQSISLQEMPEKSPAGQMPRSVDIIVENDLVDACKPGDRVAVVGIYKAIATRNLSAMSGVFRTVLVASNVSLLGKEVAAPHISEVDFNNIRAFAQTPGVFDIVSRSLAPSIMGHDEVKKGLVLQLLGGKEKILKNGAHIRGDINMLLVGDPSVAKSQLLRAMMNIAPLAVSTTGRGSSGVGLTAAVTQDKDTGERRLEAGAMVLADRGVVCIDEFDKMSDLDRVAIHEVMEQQTVTIAKAGIHASLNARCSVLAAANPLYGMYDPSLSMAANVNLPDSLLSRFDLLFIMLDNGDATKDGVVADHVLRMHRYRHPSDDGGLMGGQACPVDNDKDDDDDEAKIFVKYDRTLARGGESERILTNSFLRKYIHYCKTRTNPKLTDEASEEITNAYMRFRINSNANGLPITARTLETIIRLATAHARLLVKKDIEKSDVDAIIAVMMRAMNAGDISEGADGGAGADGQAASGKDGGDDDDSDDNDEDDDDDDGNGANAGGEDPTYRAPGRRMTAPQAGQGASSPGSKRPAAASGHATRASTRRQASASQGEAAGSGAGGAGAAAGLATATTTAEEGAARPATPVRASPNSSQKSSGRPSKRARSAAASPATPSTGRAPSGGAAGGSPGGSGKASPVALGCLSPDRYERFMEKAKLLLLELDTTAYPIPDLRKYMMSAAGGGFSEDEFEHTIHRMSVENRAMIDDKNGLFMSF